MSFMIHPLQIRMERPAVLALGSTKHRGAPCQLDGPWAMDRTLPACSPETLRHHLQRSWPAFLACFLPVAQGDRCDESPRVKISACLDKETKPAIRKGRVRKEPPHIPKLTLPVCCGNRQGRINEHKCGCQDWTRLARTPLGPSTPAQADDSEQDHTHKCLISIKIITQRTLWQASTAIQDELDIRRIPPSSRNSISRTHSCSKNEDRRRPRRKTNVGPLNTREESSIRRSVELVPYPTRAR
ncbi:hypothetical protein BJX99DRAFT_8304 [Aspergillus californicus]